MTGDRVLASSQPCIDGRNIMLFKGTRKHKTLGVGGRVGNELGMCGWCSVDAGKVVGGGIKEVSKADNSVALHTIDS